MRTARLAFRLFVFRGIARLQALWRAADRYAGPRQGMAQLIRFLYIARD